MRRWKLYLPALCFAVAIAPVLWWLLPSLQSVAHRSGPRHFDEVQLIAQQMGLYCQGDCEDGSVQTRLLISESQLTWERANTLSVGWKEGSDWIGTVAVYQGLKVHPSIHNMTPWGSFLLAGDPAVIQKLTGRTDAPGF
jgi:hypothetical protein